MSANETIRAAWGRMQAVFEKKPALAQGTGVMRAKLIEGLCCELKEDGWRFSADMPPEAGGSGQHPVPGVYGRAALASCLAIGYAVWLARAGFDWRSIEVEVQADFDHRGMVGMADVYPGYLRVRHILYIDSDASQDSLRRAIDDARRFSPYLHVFADPQPVTGEVVFATCSV